MKLRRIERRHEIKEAISENLFITDGELCELFNVSIQTIRLDRTQLNIPELRKRIKSVTKQNYKYTKGLEANEVIGDLIQVKPNHSAQSIIEIAEEYVSQKARIARGHILFVQANSLCVTLMHNSTVLTQESNLRSIEKVKLHDNVRVKATVINRANRHYDIKVGSFVKDTFAFISVSKMFYINEDENHG